MSVVNIAIIGCGFVLDKYMDTWDRHKSLNIVGISDLNKVRLHEVAKYYGLKAFPDNESLLKEDVDIVVNLTSIRSHFEVSKAALLSGKHVYSEKPLTDNLDDAKELFRIADKNSVRLSSAPSNALSSLCQTMWKIVSDGVIGDVKLIYAEFDTSPLYLKNNNLPVKNDFPFLSQAYNVTKSGAPFPWQEEFEMGCTFEHIGYHLTWMCAIFGPVKSIAGFSKQIMPEKTDMLLDPVDTPDFSVGVLNFHSGVVGRVTCSISGVNDTSMKIVGNRGMVHSHTYGDYQGPVYLELFSKMSIKWRYIRGLDTSYVANLFLGVGGRRVPLVETKSKVASSNARRASGPYGVKGFIRRIRNRLLGEQDKCIGIVELADAIQDDRAHFPPHDFSLHITELTLAIQNSGENGSAQLMETSFESIAPPQELTHSKINYWRYTKPARIARLVDRLINRS